ncbi:hypothetical protein RHMOL_Rhmol02G0242900 [Rhododendron molle]|uniref:Uncharacterized protein n=1 Tax=Rhododendron molle TaxID=49168 RepID=A0ACC0PU07_RHOML|nr:hypothetical protein RHMOL_Rhmol02G0242900 [Rhododendron molle]
MLYKNSSSFFHTYDFILLLWELSFLPFSLFLGIEHDKLTTSLHFSFILLVGQ